MTSIQKPSLPVGFDFWFRGRPAKFSGTREPGQPVRPERIEFTDDQGGEPDYNSITDEEWGAISKKLEKFSESVEQLERDLLRPLRFRWLGYLVSVAAVITSFWLIYCAYKGRGTLGAVIAFVLMSLCYGAGPAMMLAVASSFLCFYYGVVGLWLPIVSYVAGGVMLFVTLRLRRVQKLTNPNG